MAEREVLTAEEVAALLGLSVETVRALASAGRLPGGKVGREWRFSRRRIMAIVEGDGGMNNTANNAGNEGRPWERP